MAVVEGIDRMKLTRCLVEACKEVSCFAPLALAVFIGHRIFCYGGQATTTPHPATVCWRDILDAQDG